MDVSEIRTRNVAMLVTQHGGPTEFGRRVERDQVQVSQWTSEKNPKSIGHRLARSLESKLNKPRGWLDHPQWVSNAVSESVADYAAISEHSPLSRARRVQIRGNAVMDKDGFWKELDASNGDEWHHAVTDDPQAYAIRIMGRRYSPAIESGWCILMEPARVLRVEASVLVSLVDGRHLVRKFLKHESGLWAFMNVLDSNDILELSDAQVSSVHRITNRFETD